MSSCSAVTVVVAVNEETDGGGRVGIGSEEWRRDKKEKKIKQTRNRRDEKVYVEKCIQGTRNSMVSDLKLDRKFFLVTSRLIQDSYSYSRAEQSRAEHSAAQQPQLSCCNRGTSQDQI